MATLYYIHDPMCSWCWGFKPCWETLKYQLPDNIQLHYLLGGLAQETSQPMPLPMQKSIQETWHIIQREIPDIQFNFDFWKKNTPRRSTYPACRAVIATRTLNSEKHLDMIYAIQQAYYLNALNPSDTDVLLSLAVNLNLEEQDFLSLLHSDEIQEELDNEINYSQQLGAQGFPSLIFKSDQQSIFIPIDYNHPERILTRLLPLL